MNLFPFFAWLALLLLLVPAGVSASTYLFVYSTPPGAAIFLNDSSVGGVTPREQNAMPGAYTVKLVKAGYPDYTTIITIAEGTTAIVNYDFRNARAASGLPVLSSISPSRGITNTTVKISSLAGSNFASNANIRLKRSGYGYAEGSVTSVNSAGTKITGSIDLNGQAPGTYEICVYNDAYTYACGLAFTIAGPDNGSGGPEDFAPGSIWFETDPPGATIYLDNAEAGTSSFTYLNAVPGTYSVVIRKTGYQDYSGTVTVFEGRRATFSARLTMLDEDTSAVVPLPAEPVTAPARAVTTVRKSTIKVPTTWPGTVPAEESPVDSAIVIVAAGIALGFAVHRHW